MTSRKTRIEQAIARGWSPERIAHDLHIGIPDVIAVWDAMNTAAAEPDTDPDPCPPLFTWQGRRISTYFGPASPAVIEELIDALCPERNRDRKGRWVA